LNHLDVSKVVLENLTKVFTAPRVESVKAVSGLSLQINSGERCVMVGPSGCGKSTTLRLIAGLEKPTSGRILIGDRDATLLPPEDREVAMVFQSLALFPHLTAYENMAMGLRIRKVAERDIRSRIELASKTLEITDCLQRKPAGLSGGQRQRVSLGRALVRQARVLLLDEPLSNLDAPLRAQMRRDLTTLHDQLGCTLIHVTHDQTEALSMGSRVAVLNHGRLQQIDEPLQVYHHPANQFVAGFIGVPSMNFFLGEIRILNERLSFFELPPQSLGKRSQIEGSTSDSRPLLEYHPDAVMNASMGEFINKPILLGIRPEHLVPLKGSPPGEGIAHFMATVKRSEFLGAETLIHGATPHHNFTSRITNGPDPSVSGMERFGFDASQARFFDPANGSAIC
jgi:multiple sugar transport system ATP-binding protein